MIKNLLILVIIFVLAGCKSTTDATPSKCSSFDKCVASISDRVRANAKWICDQKSNDKRVQVNVLVARNGQLNKAEIISPSNDEEFNQAALNAVYDSLPLIEVAQLGDTEFEKASGITFTFVGNISNE